jgi:hypothetical protein
MCRISLQKRKKNQKKGFKKNLHSCPSKSTNYGYYIGIMKKFQYYISFETNVSHLHLIMVQATNQAWPLRNSKTLREKKDKIISGWLNKVFP